MCDRLMRQFRVQLTMAMDSVLRSAVFEAIKIFENVMYSYQMELAQKGGEVAELKVKLQTAELKLKELKEDKFDDCREKEKNQTQKFVKRRKKENQTQKFDKRRKTEKNQTQKEPVVVNVPTQTSEAPEVDFEVPDDWCAPLGSEVVVKKEDAACPSVKLRQFSIPLYHIPINYKVADDDQGSSGKRRSKRIYTLNQKSKRSQHGPLPIFDKEGQHLPVTSGGKILLQDLKQEYPALFGVAGHERGKQEDDLLGNEYGSAAKQRESITTDADAANPEGIENDHQSYFCQFCHKEFDNKFSVNVHAQHHNRCRACRRRFFSRSELLSHKESCSKYQQLKKKQAAKSQKTLGIPPKVPKIPKNPGAHVSANNSRGSSRKRNKNFDFSRLRKHMETYVIEKTYRCSMCPATFFTPTMLRAHMKRRHPKHVNAPDPN